MLFHAIDTILLTESRIKLLTVFLITLEVSALIDLSQSDAGELRQSPGIFLPKPAGSAQSFQRDSLPLCERDSDLSIIC